MTVLQAIQILRGPLGQTVRLSDENRLWFAITTADGRLIGGTEDAIYDSYSVDGSVTTNTGGEEEEEELATLDQVGYDIDLPMNAHHLEAFATLTGFEL